MEQYIPKSVLVAEIERRWKYDQGFQTEDETKAYQRCCDDILYIIKTLEVKDVDSMIHTIIAECCDWLAMNTNLSHDEIEGCRNLMLTVKDEQLKAQKGENE